MVWVIAIWFIVGVLGTLTSFLAVKSGVIPLGESQHAYIDSLNSIDYAATILIACLNLLGAACLFFLRKEALSLFICSLVLNLFLTTWQFYMEGLAAALSSGLVGIFCGLGLLSVVCYYTWQLKKKQVLV